MRTFAVAVAIAASLFTMSGAMADRAIKGVYSFEQSGETRTGTRMADREVCIADITGASCASATGTTQRPAWRGLN